MGISITGGVKVPQGKFSVYVAPPPPTGVGLWAWGDNGSPGKLGLGDTTTDRSSPVQVGSLTNWASISTGNHSLALKTNGELWTWGFNHKGQLGQGDVGAGTYRSSPVQIGALTDWASAVIGGNKSHALKINGSLWAWGDGLEGVLGLGNTTGYSSPVQIGDLSDWASVSSGSFSSLAVKTDGTLWAWGKNSINGELGDGTIINKSSPVQIGILTNWANVSTNNASLAVKTDGSLWAWGKNTQGQLGQEDTIGRSSPVQIGTLTDWAFVKSADLHTFAIKTNGSLWAWGSNYKGGLGLGDAGAGTYRSSPVQVGSLTDWANITGTGAISLAVKTDGSLWVWGRNNIGQHGLGDNGIDRSSPVQIGALTDWISASGGSNHFHALKGA